MSARTRNAGRLLGTSTSYSGISLSSTPPIAPPSRLKRAATALARRASPTPTNPQDPSQTLETAWRSTSSQEGRMPLAPRNRSNKLPSCNVRSRTYLRFCPPRMRSRTLRLRLPQHRAARGRMSVSTSLAERTIYGGISAPIITSAARGRRWMSGYVSRRPGLLSIVPCSGRTSYLMSIGLYQS